MDRTLQPQHLLSPLSRIFQRGDLCCWVFGKVIIVESPQTVEEEQNSFGNQAELERGYNYYWATTKFFGGDTQVFLCMHF